MPKVKNRTNMHYLSPATKAFNDFAFQQTSVILSYLFQVHIVPLILLISYCSARLQTELCMIQSYIRQTRGSGTEGPGNLLAVKRVRYHFNGTVSPIGLTFTGSCNDPENKRGIWWMGPVKGHSHSARIWNTALYPLELQFRNVCFVGKPVENQWIWMNSSGSTDWNE